jgi:4-hydroxy-tetrahydrodipicolinate reductase
MAIAVCIAGATGWTGSVIARAGAGKDLGVALGGPATGVIMRRTLDEVLADGARPEVLVDYTDPTSVKPRARELAESLGQIRPSELAVAIDKTHGPKEVRGATIGGTQVHSVRLPGFVVAFETIFGLPDERLTIHHDAGAGAEPYVGGTVLAIRKVMEVNGLGRGLDTLLFGRAADA